MLTRGGSELIRRQFEFLEQDLIKANKNRENVPWIVVNGHRSMYCSCDNDCVSEAEQQRLGPWSNGTYDQGVDLFVNGHEHNVERNWPTYQGKSTPSNENPNAPIYIVTGAAGCKELHEPFVLPQPPRSAFRSNTFGYSRMIVHNSSHVRWQQVMTDPTYFRMQDYGTIIDDVWIVQENHGPFKESEAPKDEDEEHLGISIDHWDNVPHPETGVRLPKGTTWRNKENVAKNTKLAGFMKMFGDTIWEDQHDNYHTSMAVLMKRYGASKDPIEQDKLMEQMKALAISQA